MPNHDPDEAIQQMDELFAWRAERLIEIDMKRTDDDGFPVDLGGGYFGRVTMDVPLTAAGSIWMQNVLGMVPFGPDTIGHHALCAHCDRPIIYVADQDSCWELEHATVSGMLQSHVPEPDGYYDHLR